MKVGKLFFSGGAAAPHTPGGALSSYEGTKEKAIRKQLPEQMGRCEGWTSPACVGVNELCSGWGFSPREEGEGVSYRAPWSQGCSQRAQSLLCVNTLSPFPPSPAHPPSSCLFLSRKISISDLYQFLHSGKLNSNHRVILIKFPY